MNESAIEGLDGIVAHLRATGYVVEIAGGVARIDNECNGGWYGITNDYDASGDDFHVYFYEDAAAAGGRSLAEDARTRQTWALELYTDVSERLLAEYAPPAVARILNTREDVRRFFDGLRSAGVNFHPDERADGYSPPLHPSHDAAVARCFEVADDHGFDVYEVALEVFGGA